MPAHVLITGGAGFIGTRLAQRLVDAGHAVTVLDSLISQVHGDDPATTSPLLGALPREVRFQRGDVRDRAALLRAVDGVEVVVHLAAETGTGQSMYEIDRYVATNVGGTALLLDVLANDDHGVTRVIVASSRATYGEGAYATEDGRTVYPAHRSDDTLSRGDFDVHHPGEGALRSVPTSEDAALHPSSVYGITKQTQESLVMTVAPTFGARAVSLRYQNVYGPGQSLSNPYTGILSIFSTLIRQGLPLNIFEDGLESRDFVYIDDVVEATYLAATSSLEADAILNVGSGVATTVLEVARTLQEYLAADVPVEVTGNYRLGDIRHNVADTTAARETLAFAAAVPFREGARRFVDWVLTEPVGGDGYERSLDEMRQRRLLK